MAEYDRFRSFAERYVIERAKHFTKGTEREEAWAATLDAKTIYRSIADVAKNAEPESEAQQAGAGQLFGAQAAPVQIRTRLPSGKFAPVAAPPPNTTKQNIIDAIRHFVGRGEPVPTELMEAAMNITPPKTGGKP